MRLKQCHQQMLGAKNVPITKLSIGRYRQGAGMKQLQPFIVAENVDLLGETMGKLSPVEEEIFFS